MARQADVARLRATNVFNGNVGGRFATVGLRAQDLVCLD
jgi:hypothetical protein